MYFFLTVAFIIVNNGLHFPTNIMKKKMNDDIRTNFINNYFFYIFQLKEWWMNHKM